MKLKIFYAACIAVIALSCDNDKMQGLHTPSNDITLAKPAETKPAGLVNEKNKLSKNLSGENEIATADTTTIENDTDKNVLQSGGPEWIRK